MIKSEGVKDKKKMVVEYDNGKFTFNGKEDNIYEPEINILLKTDLPMFGTYCSIDPEDELNIVGKLQNYFFDKQAKVTSDHDIIGDWEKDVVY